MVGERHGDRSRAADEWRESSLALAHGVVYRDLGDRILVRHDRDGAEFEIAGSGVAIWRQLAHGTSDVHLSQRLDQQFVGNTSVAEESMRFVTKLSERGLVVRGE